MTHRRQAIREQVATLLTGLATGAAVTIGRVYPWDVPSLPSIDVATLSETAEDYTAPNRQHGRALTVQIECRADGDDYPATLDQMALEIEQAIAASDDIGGLASWSRLIETTLEQSNEVESPIGLLRLQYVCTYTVTALDPQ